MAPLPPAPLVRRARTIARTSGFVAVSLAFIPPFALRMRATRLAGRPRERLRDAWLGVWARALLRMFAIDVAVDGDLPPPPARGRIIVANHRSAIDIGVMLATFGGEMVSRGDLADWPLLGVGAKAADTVFVDRSESRSGALALRAVQRRLREGRTVHVFPEGTTFDGDEVRPFMPGAFVAALGAKAEILPVGLAYPAASSAAYVDETFPQHLARLAGGAPTRMAVAVGRPFHPEPGERAAALSSRAHREVTALVARARGVAGP